MACPSLLSLAARRAGRAVMALAVAAAPLLAVGQTTCPEIKVSVSPAGPLTLCPGGSVTLTATAVLAGAGTGTGFDADVYALKRLSSEKVLVGGSFTTYRGAAAGRFIRLNADGSPDAGYRTGTGFNGAVRAVLPLRDGKVLVGGDFTAYDGTAGVNYLARLNRDGTLDASFRPGSGLGAAPGNGVNALLGLDNGRVLVGGQFGSYNGTTGLGNIVVVAATGLRDAAFVAAGGGFDAPVRALMDAGANLTLVGGDFTRYRGVAAGRLARLSLTAALDPTFPTAVGFNAPVLALAYNNGVMVGGSFTAYNGRPAPRIARLDAAGLPDATFNAGAGFDGPVRAITGGNNGPGLLVGGSFNAYNGNPFSSHGLLRLNANGSQDYAFNTGAAGFDAGVYALEFSYTGFGTQRVLAGGAFTAYNGTANVGRIVRLQPDATLNNADVPVPAGYTYAWFNGTNGAGAGTTTFVVTEPGFYGALATDGPNTCQGRSTPVAINPPMGEVQVARTGGGTALCAGGTATLTATATTVGAGFDGTVQALARQPDGKILVGGFFASYNGVRVPHGLVRLNADYSLDAAFNAPRPGEVSSGVGEHVEQLVLQPDGKILVGSSNLGSYNDNPGLTANLIRLNADGTPDPGFNTLDANGVPSGGGTFGLALLPSGKILVGGYGTLQRLNTDGSIDPTFNPGGTGIGRAITSTSANPVISSIAVQPDGRIVVSGAFEEYNGNAAAPNNLMRLLANGTLDPSFNPGGAGPDQYQAALVLQPDGKILTASGTSRTTMYNGNAAAPDNLMRVNADGSLDTGFNAGGSGFDAGQLYLALQPDGKILVGNGYGYNGTQNLPWNVQRLNANGSFDTAFNPRARGGANDGVYAMLPLPGGQILAGGAFTRYNGDALAPDHFLRLAADGSFANPTVPLPGATYAWNDGRTGPTLTTTRPGAFQVEATANGCTRRSAVFALPASPLTFVRTTPSGAVSLPAGGSVGITASVVRPPFVPTGSAPTSWVNGVAVLPDGKILAGGRFTTTVDGNDRRRVARYDGAGNLDFAFGSATPALDGPVNGVLPLPDERVLVWGEFRNYAGSAAPGIALLGTNGGLDNTFAPTGTGLNDAVDCAVRLFDGRMLVGGRFTSYNGTARPYLARLNADGTLDATFAQSGTGLNGAVTALALQADGQVLVGGLFTRYNGTSRPHLLRLNPNGSLDTSFDVGTGLSGGLTTNVTELLVQPDGGIVVAGQFTSYFRTPCAHLLRLDASGNFDNSFRQTGTGFDGPLNAAVLQPDGKIVVGGLFGNYNGVPRAAVARLNADGTLDATFTTTGSGFNGQLNALALQADGQVVAGGLFTSYNGSPRNYLARLNPNGSLNNADTPVAGATVAWPPGTSAANPLVVNSPGSYVATATLPDGCTATAAAVVVSQGLGTAPAQAAALALWPNPARTAATLRLPATATARTVLVADALGRVVRQLPLPAQAAALTLDLSGLPAGVYVVRCGAAAARLVLAAE